jgi:hypothetical protein
MIHPAPRADRSPRRQAPGVPGGTRYRRYRALAGPEPEARIAGLRAASVFAVEVAAPAVRALLEDPDPEVAAVAREAVTTVDGVRRTDQLRGDTGP